MAGGTTGSILSSLTRKVSSILLIYPKVVSLPSDLTESQHHHRWPQKYLARFRRILPHHYRRSGRLHFRQLPATVANPTIPIPPGGWRCVLADQHDPDADPHPASARDDRGRGRDICARSASPPCVEEGEEEPLGSVPGAEMVASKKANG